MNRLLLPKFAIIIVLLHMQAVIANDLSSLIMDKIIQSKSTKIMCSYTLRCGSSLTKQFYQNESGVPIWSKDGQLLPNADKLITILNDSYHDGLNPDNYHVQIIKKLRDNLNHDDAVNAVENKQTDLAAFDITLTDAFFLYTSNQAYGQINNKKVYPHWSISKRSVDLMAILNQATASNDIQSVLNSLTPQYPEYNHLKQKLADYQNIATHGGWPIIESGPTLHPGEHGKRILQLQQRLVATGELANITAPKNYDNALKLAIAKFQASHGLNSDGVAGKSTLQALNIPINMRIQQIELNMDRLRWLPTDLGSRYILVNIPDYSLNVIESSASVLSMPVIVGKDEGLQSCVLSSQITYLDLNPYWYIPHSIAIKDILPKLKQDPGYLAKNDIKVYTDYTNPNSEIDAKTISWSKITPDNFAYKLREEPGSDNPLGQIKFIFPNSCGIYLHDTSTPGLFKSARRDLSHGCIRIGKPLELAAYLLADKPQWTKDKIQAAIDLGDNKAITLTTPMNIHIVYATVWVDNTGVLQFRNDIYNIDDIPYKLWLPKKTHN